MLETVVFGQIAGRFASEYIKDIKGSQSDEKTLGYIQDEEARLQSKVNQWLKNKSKRNVYHLFHRLRHLMMDKVGIFREKKKLAEALEEIREIRHEYRHLSLWSDCLRYCQEFITMMEFESMLDIAEVITMGALAREETRGSHYRTDFPTRDDQHWLKHTIARYNDGRPQLTYREVKITRYEPQERKY